MIRGEPDARCIDPDSGGGWFGNLKSNNTEGLTRGAFRVMGIAKTSLTLGVYAAATNLRLLAAWRTRQERAAVPGAEPATRSSKITGRGSSARSATRKRAGPTTT